MSHFYGNALSILSDAREEKRFTQILESYHYEAIRTLPSFRKHISDLMSSNDLGRARALLQDDQVLLTEVKQALRTGRQISLRILRRFHVFQRVSQEPVDSINLYMSFMEGNIQTSDFLTVLIESLKSMTPMQMLVFLSRIETAIEDGDSGIELSGCTDEDDVIMTIIQDMKHKISELSNAAEETEMPVRSSGVIHSKGLRTTVIAQRVQLSYAESTLTALEKEFLEQNERLSTLLEDYFIMADPRHLFLNEIWLVDSTTTLLDAFAPHPREAIETTLSTPYHFLDRRVPRGGTTLSITLPATAILYQRYLEAGSIINMADLWSSFLEIVAGDAEEADEREVLMQFYRALADLKLMGMVKQSKKKADHLAKVSWEGL
jgi:origin recognition complex subunit 3